MFIEVLTAEPIKFGMTLPFILITMIWKKILFPVTLTVTEFMDATTRVTNVLPPGQSPIP